MLWEGRAGGATAVGTASRADSGGRAGRVKALVWFWLIDETLSANLVYQSDYKIGSTF